MGTDWLAIAAIITAGGKLMYDLVRGRFENRKSRAEARNTNAQAEETELGLLDDYRAQFVAIGKDMSVLRDRVLKAEASSAKAEARAAQAHADLAVALANASDERHKLQHQILERDARNTRQEHRIRTLEAEVASLRAQINQEHPERLDP